MCTTPILYVQQLSTTSKIGVTAVDVDGQINLVYLDLSDVYINANITMTGE